MSQDLANGLNNFGWLQTKVGWIHEPSTKWEMILSNNLGIVWGLGQEIPYFPQVFKSQSKQSFLV